MASILEMAQEMVVARAQTTAVSTEDMLSDLKRFYAELKKLESGGAEIETAAAEEASSAAPTLSLKDAFKKNEVRCLICGKGGFKTLTRHLAAAHRMKPGEYKKQFNIPGKQPLSAKSYSESRRKMAQERGLAANLAKAREARMANLEAKKGAPAKAKAPAKPKAAPAKAKAAKAKPAAA